MHTHKEEFIIKGLQTLTVLAAFLKDQVYVPFVSTEDKRNFREELFAFVDPMLKDYSNKVSDEKHIDNIRAIIDFSSGRAILWDEQLTFGISQRFFNLYLKHLWCYGKIEIPPPHFPLDRKIQEKLEMKPLPWFEMKGTEGESDYLNIIEKTRRYLAPSGIPTIAELELILYGFDGRITDLIKRNRSTHP